MKKVISFVMAILLIAVSVISFTGSSVSDKIIPSLDISSKNISYEISDSLYGVSLQNKGNAIDGGLVANLVNNNSFEYMDNPIGAWEISADRYAVESMAEDRISEFNSNYLTLAINDEGTLKNLGYTERYNYKTYQVNNKKTNTPDMSFHKNEIYNFSAYFKNIDYVGTITVTLLAEGNKEKYQFNIDNCTEWMPISLEIKSDVTGDGALLLTFEGTGNLCVDQVTLVPMSSYGYGSAEWKYMTLRSDLMQALYDLSPSFIRFNASESGWKNTVGPLETRIQEYIHISKNEFYVTSNAMGMYEYLLLCDDLNSLAVPVLNAGIISSDVKGYNDKRAEYENGSITEEAWQTYLDEIAYRPETEQFQEYIQDVFDLIEYANGDETTLWGAKRIEDGHKDSFKLQYIAISQGEFGELYRRNFDAVYNAVNEKYPDIKIISCQSENDKGEKENYNNTFFDEHCVTDGGELLKQVHRYDEYERSGAGVIVSEYSVDTDIGDTLTKNNIWSAIENAAFLTGVEKNGDLVKMASYETPLTKVNAQEGDTSLMWFTSHNIVKTPDYYMQMLFANNVGTNYVSTTANLEENGIYHSVTVDTTEKVVYVKLVNTTKTPTKLNLNLEGFKKVKNPTAQYMAESFKSACNEPSEDLHVAPVQTELSVKDNVVACDVGGYSINVVRIPYSDNDGASLFELPENDLIVPFIPAAFGIVISCALVVGVLATGVVILLVRLKHHKKLRDKEKK